MPSVLTLNKNRELHLLNLIEGLNRSTKLPTELIIVEMGDTSYKLPQSNFPIKTIAMPCETLPLAKARNIAAKNAVSSTLLFLDVDCIPASNFVEIMFQAVRHYNQIISCEVRYLPRITQMQLEEKQLKFLGKPHEARSFPKKGYKIEHNPGLFWSLAFGLSIDIFTQIGLFSEDYIGYGAEDTDFGFRAAARNIEHWLTSETRVYHQYHESTEPPYQHFFDIIANAKTFYKKWQQWPMEGWLTTFAKEGLIEWRPQDNDIIILAAPYTS
ncbi:glycosyltransferase [Bartonella sp. TP]|uniref:glycosyltransferase family 2 protein n=1 Tax=Bartonella sp. TP TaxID=3057550 RepID=UPI0025AFC06A|nr:glycosyltransferase [Bartonella sp. TP]WJW79791.1 glycosyltransferase [Bartonella sp. TP]